MYRLNIKNAYLHNDLQEEVYMIQPQGYEIQGDQTSMCRLRKVYGLKQSPRAWFDKFNTAIAQFSLQRSVSDHSVFVCRSSFGTFIFVYVMT